MRRSSPYRNIILKGEIYRPRQNHLPTQGGMGELKKWGKRKFKNIPLSEQGEFHINPVLWYLP